MESKKEVYKNAVKTLADSYLTTLILVSRPEETPLKEAARASKELAELGVNNQILVLNGVLSSYDDSVSESLYKKQQNAFLKMPEGLLNLALYTVPLRAYNITGVENVRALLTKDNFILRGDKVHADVIPELKDVIEDLYCSNRRVIFTMGKGGVGKTTVAAAIALGLSKKGKKVHLTTTDPAAHLKFVLRETGNITMSHIDEQAELKKYQTEVLEKARAEGMSPENIAYIEEDLRSPCTQEIAVFRAFADVVEKADEQIVVIDTVPTGHTLLLLESTQSYNHEIQRTKGEIPAAVMRLLPRLKSNEIRALTMP